MKFFTFILLQLSFIIFSQDYVTPKPISWDELKVLQSNFLNKSIGDHSISPQCFQNIEAYKDFPRQDFMQNILWTTYVWSRYEMKDGLFCTVITKGLYDKAKHYKVLSTFESQVLLSASEGIGFEENGFFEFSKEINQMNAEVSLYKTKPINEKNLHPKDFEVQFPIIYQDETSKTIIFPQLKQKDSYSNNSEKVQRAYKRIGITHNQTLTYPYYNMTRGIANYPPCGFETFTAFMVTRNTSVAPAHSLYQPNCGGSPIYSINRLAQHRDNGALVTHFGEFNAANAKIPLSFSGSQNLPSQYDYAVMRFNNSFIAPLYMKMTATPNLSKGSAISNIGYPSDSQVEFNMYEHFAVVDNISSQFIDFNQSPDEFLGGQSGSPFFTSSNNSTFGIGITGHPSGDNYGVINRFTPQKISNISNWADWNPTAVINFTGVPQYGGVYNLTEIQPFSAVVNAIKQIKLDGTIIEKGTSLDALVKWESSIDGAFGTTSTVSADKLKAELSGGVHFITAKIDSNGEQGESSVFIEIIRPVGQFTSPNRCIKNIANPTTCTFNLSWNVTDTPETSVVLNDTANNDFATGNSGSQSFTATPNNTRFKLYPSNQKKILLDTLNTNSLSIKTPTGNLNRTVAVCSLHPSPINPRTLQLRDPKITPNGCGTKLTWSNVKWVVPSIYYRLIGSGTWQHLYTIPCELNGTLCSGEVDTDQILPELIPVAGAQFKLMQFNSASSGQLSAPFSVTAHRFADVYEYDGGDVSDFNGMGVGIPNSMVINNTLTTAASLGVAQHNHSFHSPAVYDSRVDIDTTQVQVAQTPGAAGFTEGKRLSVTVFNMSNGLNVDIQLQCAGIVTGGIFDGQTGVFDFDSDPTSPIVTDPATGAKTMEFVITGQTNQIGSLINCLYNRVIIKRIAGTPSENLRYSVVINDPATTTTPVVNTASSVCNHNYCIQLLGNNFSTSASVQVREDINGSATLATFSGNDIYNRTSFNGQDRLQWPIQNLSMQNKFRTNGLCFKVISSGLASNEKCFKRPATAAQGLFMGKSIASYLPNSQDIEHTSYVVVGSGGSKLKLMGNSWKKISYNYNVTANTILQFEFRSDQQQAEINAVGLIASGADNVRADRSWQIYGTQNWGHQSHHNYQPASWKTYRIPIGQTFNGLITDMVFAADEDVHVGQNVIFKNPVLLEGFIPDQYDDVPLQRPYDDDVRERSVSWLGTDVEHLQNFHDSGDTDWTIVYMSGTRRFRTEMIGANADTKMSIYKWISADAHPSGNGTFVNIVDQLIGSDNSLGSSTYIVNNGSFAVYAAKVESRNNAFGHGTEYKLIIDTPTPITPDQYDNVPSQRPYNDDIKERSVLWLGADTEHLQNFHDSGDTDWTIVYMSGTRRIRTEMIGAHSDTKLSVYKWISGDAHPSGNGTFINIVDQFLGSDNSSGNSQYIINNGALAVYAVKVQSQNGNFGSGTEYKLIIDTP